MKKQTKSNISPDFFDFEFFYEQVTGPVTVKIISDKKLPELNKRSGKSLFAACCNNIKLKS